VRVVHVCRRLADYMGDDVKYVITEDNWDDTFDAVSPTILTLACLMTSCFFVSLAALFEKNFAVILVT